MDRLTDHQLSSTKHFPKTDTEKELPNYMRTFFNAEMIVTEVSYILTLNFRDLKNFKYKEFDYIQYVGTFP